jgi:hypothetical protein
VVAAWQVRALPLCIRCVTSTFLYPFVCCGWCASGTALPGATRVVARGTSTRGGQVCPRQTVSGATWGACGRWTPQGGECAATCGGVAALSTEGPTVAAVQVRGVLSPCARAWCQFTPPLLVLNVLNVRPGVDVVGAAAEGGRASTSKHHPPSKRPRRQGDGATMRATDDQRARKTQTGGVGGGVGGGVDRGGQRDGCQGPRRAGRGVVGRWGTQRARPTRRRTADMEEDPVAPGTLVPRPPYNSML